MRTPETQARLAMLEANLRAKGFTGQLVVGKRKKKLRPDPLPFRCWPDWALLAIVLTALYGIGRVAF